MFRKLLYLSPMYFVIYFSTFIYFSQYTDYILMQENLDYRSTN